MYIRNFLLGSPAPRAGKGLSCGIWVAGQLAWLPGWPKAGLGITRLSARRQSRIISLPTAK
jgi:hypothetical protein